MLPNSKGKIPLHYAAREGRIELVEYFLHHIPRAASMATDKRKLALHFAAGDGHVSVCRALLKVYPRGASLPSAKGKLPLHLCARWGHMDVAYDLIRVFPDAVRALDWEGSLPLHDAAREGQLEMSRYLLDLFPMALSTSNLRNEIPLFPAVRSGSLDLVALLVQAWPAGSRCILQNISADDSLHTGWMSWDILELLLRGAVQKLYGCPLLQGKIPPRAVLMTSDNWRTIVQPPMPPCWALQKPKKENNNITIDEKKSNKKLRIYDTREVDNDIRYQTRLLQESMQPIVATVAAAAAAAPTETEDIEGDMEEIAMSTVMRSKSPILQEVNDTAGFGHRKRSCYDSFSSSSTLHPHQDEYSAESTICFCVPEEQRKFIPLHAALECSASYHVIQYVLDHRYEEDIQQCDERGMLPLHWAVVQCYRPQLDTTDERELMIRMILNKLIVKKDDGSFNAATIRDNVYHRLPLHFALWHQADHRIITTLIDAYPSSAVEKCQTRDIFYDKTPLHIAIQCDCELDTVYTLLKLDPTFLAKQRILVADRTES
jgi:ankyrin repeat protein